MTRPTLRLAATVATVAALLAACRKGEEKKVPGTPPLPEGTTALTAKDRLEEPEVTERCYSAPTRMVFHSQREWDAYWHGSTPPGCPLLKILPSVDWGKEMLVYASMGRRMSLDDRISIDGSGVRHDSVIVAVRRYMGKDGCNPTTQPVFPQSLVKLPADTRPLRFSEVHVKVPCDPATQFHPSTKVKATAGTAADSGT